MKVFGGSPAGPATEEETFEVWPENWKAVEMFLRLQTQWVVGGMGSLIGLNYQSVSILFEVYKVKNRRKMLEQIQAIERGALDAIGRLNAKKAGSSGA